MPIYLYKCGECGKEVEMLQSIEGEAPLCCGKKMTKLPTFPAMVKWKGEGGFPSRRKQHKGTAPYTKS